MWAPYQNRLWIKIQGKGSYEMERGDKGYFTLELCGVKPGDLYWLMLSDGSLIPDPASRFQPEGVHGPSSIIDPSYPWRYDRVRVALEDLVIYEVHIGTFTPKGTFDAAIEKLDHLVNLGVTAIEIMPIAQSPGDRDWGYNGVYLYAVQNTYGGPSGFRRFVDEAHARGLAVILDVVYNHIGPEGNYMGRLGPYLTNRYRTPWGLTFNFDGPGSDEVRRFILDNVRFWLSEYRVDGLRLDAIHAIYDNSLRHILQEIAEVTHSLGGFVIAESDLNDPKIVSRECGYGLDAQWNDDFHHAVHAYITGETTGYYADFGSIGDIAKAYREVFVYDGKYSRYRGKTHGAPVGDLDGCRFVVYIQNHDQVGNRGGGERLSSLVDKKTYLAAASLYMLSPYIPMIFMGEEYFEKKPFLYFSSFSDRLSLDVHSNHFILVHGLIQGLPPLPAGSL
ncbi:MAG TPA: malto-oligosyltrehalose trehalohydrolase [Sulfolobales archaeon]|nr:malto-oligosyltrehalose trehalohydrolase [Sulfolobales archaeon]